MRAWRRKGRRGAAIAVVLLVGATFAAPARAHASTASAMLRLINRARALHHVPRLVRDRRLARAAIGHSRDMVAHRYFAHTSRAGLSPADRVARTGWMRGRPVWQVGEDLAWHVGRPSARSIVRAWLRSPPHRRVLLDPVYRVAGIGIARGTPRGAVGATFTAELGS